MSAPALWSLKRLLEHEMPHWSDRLKATMDDQRITSAELSRMTGISANLIRSYRNGDIDNPRGNAMQQLADALGVTKLWLSDGETTATNETDAGSTEAFKELLARVIPVADQVLRNQNVELPIEKRTTLWFALTDAASAEFQGQTGVSQADLSIYIEKALPIALTTVRQTRT